MKTFMNFEPFFLAFLKCPLFLFCFSLHLTATKVPLMYHVDSHDARIQWMGRVEQSESGTAMGFPGVVFRFNYHGRAPIVHMHASTPTCYFNVRWNDSPPIIMQLNEGDNELRLPFPDAATATLEFYRRTESWMGTVVFQGLSIHPDTSISKPPALPQRKLMFIGDSVICGEFNERFPPNELVSPETTNVETSVGPILAKKLNAQVHMIAYGGQGILRDWSGETKGEQVVLAPDYFERAVPSNPDSKWDHTQYQPDVIIISIGTDFDSGMLEDEDYNEVFFKFTQRVREAYPNAHILLTESGFQSDQPKHPHFRYREQLKTTLLYVVKEFHKLRDEAISFTPCGYYAGTSKDSHLTVFQHMLLAGELFEPIRKILEEREAIKTNHNL